MSVHSLDVTCGPIGSDPAPPGHVVDLAGLSATVTLSHRDRKVAFLEDTADGTFFLADNLLDGDTPTSDTNIVAATGLSRQNSSVIPIASPACSSLASPMPRDLLLMDLPCSETDKLFPFIKLSWLN